MGLVVGVTAFTYLWDKYKTIIVAVFCLIVFLIVRAVVKNKQRRAAYLALPVISIGNASTKTYHCPSCRQIENANRNNLIAFRHPSEPVRAGYKPCNICKP